MRNKNITLSEPPEYLAVTGRVSDWLTSPDSRLPVSCTTFSVEDSMSGINGIEDSWLFTSYGIRHAAGVAIDLSKLRAKGTENGKGLTSSGVVSFAKFYSLLNQELRRGGIYKNGACTVFLDHNHQDCEDFLKASPSDLPWVKKALYIDESIKDNPLLPLIAEKVNNGTLWLAKKQYDKQNNRLYSNVCCEILLKHRGTCLLAHVNLGSIVNPEDIPQAFVDSMRWLCELHAITGVEESGYYLSQEDDRQVGLGVIGLANLLAIHNVTYAEFVEALEDVLAMKPYRNTMAFKIAYNLYAAYQQSARVANDYKMDRAFTIAPTASCSYRHLDVQGFTTAPEISPPIDYEIDRDSETLGVKTYEYNPRTQIAREVGWNIQWRLLNAWQKLMNSTGKAHAISANLWNSFTVTPDWIVDTFLPSPLKTTYYRLNVDNQALDKTEVLTEESNEEKFRGVYDEPEALVCSPLEDVQYCSSCGG